MKNDLEKYQYDNLGGANNFRFAYAEEIDIMPPVLEGAVHLEVELIPGTRWYDGYFTEGNGSLSDQPADSGHGTSYVKKFSFVIPHDRADLVDFCNRNKNRRFILDVMDNNSQRKLVGSKEEPLYLMAGFDTKTAIAERNECAFTFSGEGIDRSPVYNV